jgi:hypothetical protein
MTSKLLSRSLIAAFVPVVLAVAGITPARAEPPDGDDAVAPQDPYDPYDSDDSDDAAQPEDAQPAQPEAAPVQPGTPAPAMRPPAPPANPPPAGSSVQVAPRGPQPAAGGQWVYTQQNGWLWMPYGQQYVYTPQETSGGAYPQEYVFVPSYGWRWVAAPWVWGFGPQVYFSIGGPRYHWYRGFGSHYYRPYYRGYYRPYYRPGYRGTFRGHFGGSHYSGGRFGGHHFGGRRH